MHSAINEYFETYAVNHKTIFSTARSMFKQSVRVECYSVLPPRHMKNSFPSSMTRVSIFSVLHNIEHSANSFRCETQTENYCKWKTRGERGLWDRDRAARAHGAAICGRLEYTNKLQKFCPQRKIILVNLSATSGIRKLIKLGELFHRTWWRYAASRKLLLLFIFGCSELCNK